MSKSVRQTALSGLFGSKRFIVSVCAAVAMVLGALSVGASIFVPQSAAETQQEQAARSPIFTERRSKTNTAAPSQENGSAFTSQRILVPNLLQQPKPNGVPLTASPPNAKTSLSIEFGPVNVSAGISLGSLQVKVDAPSLAPTIEVTPLPLTPVDPPVAGTTPQTDPTKQAQPADSSQTSPTTDPTATPSNPSTMSTMDTASTDTPPANNKVQ